jgi:hypothetical protein
LGNHYQATIVPKTQMNSNVKVGRLKAFGAAETNEKTYDMLE